MTDPSQTSADYSLRILWSLGRWIEDHKGREALNDVAKAAGVGARDFDGSTVWVSHEQFETVLRIARNLTESDEEFSNACAYRFKESYGPFRHMVWALSPQRLFETAVKVSKQVTKAGEFEILRSATASFAVRYRSTHAESRLMCLSRQVHWRLGPTMWNLPPAYLDERACIARGDGYCEYELRWFDGGRSLPILAGSTGGLAAAWLSAALLGSQPTLWLAFPLLGAALGYVRELRRTQRANIQLGQELNDVLRNLGQVESEARSEIYALHQRQNEWTALVEQQVASRTTALEKIVAGLDSLQQSRVTSLRGFSHDLRNPLFVVRGNTQFLRERITDPEEIEALSDMELASGQIEEMLTKLMDVASQDTDAIKFAPKPIAIAPLSEIFRRRLRALVHGRDIKVSVFATREAPESIVIDPLVFDRIVDNLLTNASKYTESGSILLELSGSPEPGPSKTVGWLTFKLSDTGQGIAPERVEQIFRPRASSEPRTARSFGIGLSGAVRLLAQIGGRLDVMSKVGVGTTFWAHFPRQPPRGSRAPVAPDESLESVINRVVTIRKVDAS